MTDWFIEAYLFDVRADTIPDRIVLHLPDNYTHFGSAKQFSELRQWAKSNYPKQGEEKHLVLRTQHRPSSEELQWQIYRDGEKFRTSRNGELITLEASVKLMKKEITEWLKGAE